MLDRLAGFRPYSAPNVLLMLAQAPKASGPPAAANGGRWPAVRCRVSSASPGRTLSRGSTTPLTTEPKIEGMSSRWPIVRWTPPPPWIGARLAVDVEGRAARLKV